MYDSFMKINTQYKYLNFKVIYNNELSIDKILIVITFFVVETILLS